VIDGLMGFLFVGSELRALREFEWEIVSAKMKAESDSKYRSDSPSPGSCFGSTLSITISC
jgi:sphingomyelin phosphodiesterase 2